MDKHQKGFHEKTAKQIIEALKKRRMAGSYAETADQAKEEILEMIPDGTSVYRCGSMTLIEVGFWEALQSREGVEVINPFAPGLNLQESMSERVRGFSADFLITGANAITLDGRLVNLDRTGNRVAAMIFGPKKVYVVAGINKIVRDVNEGLWRASNVASPINAKRLNRNTGISP